MYIKKFLGLLILGSILILWSLPGFALASHTAPMPSTTSASTLSVALGSSADNTLYEDAAGSLSNGAGTHFFVGRTGQTADSIRRGLIKFDVSSSLPPTATIVGVTLYLTMSQSVAGPEPVELHRVTASWGEGSSIATGGEGGGAPAAAGDATWIHRFYSSTLWTTAGGDFVVTTSATTTVSNVGPYSWSAPGMVSDVQMWLDTPSINNGWLLLGNEATSSTAKRFDAKENADSNARPMLVVTYLLLPHKTYLPIVLK
jgi:hypothetical protein